MTKIWNQSLWTWLRRRQGLYVDIPCLSYRPCWREGGPGGIQNLLKEEWKELDGTEKKEDDYDQEEMEGKRRNEEKMQRSLVVVKFPLVPFATCLLPLELLLQGFFHQQEVKQPHRSDTQKTLEQEL